MLLPVAPPVVLLDVEGAGVAGGVDDVDGGLAAMPPRVPALPEAVPELFVEPALPLELLLEAPALLPPVDPVCAYDRPIALTTNMVAIAEARDFFIVTLLN
jgi:hypothetical protein